MWKTIKDFSEYAVSDSGLVMNIAKNQRVNTYMNNGGFPIVAIYREKRQFMRQVHRLVAEAYIENPDGLPLVKHRDENKCNNEATNLYWAKVRSNGRYPSVEGPDKTIKATDLSTGQVQQFDTSGEAARMLVKLKRALSAGRVVTVNTAQQNIKKSLTQPALYPAMYGYKWEIERSY